MGSMTVTEGYTVTLPSCSFTRDYAAYAGWSSTDGGSVEYADGAEFTMGREMPPSMPSGQVQLHLRH